MYSFAAKSCLKRGFTIVEMMVALTITLVVTTSVITLSVMGGKLYKSIHTQQMCLQYAKKTMDGALGLNRELHMAYKLSINGYSNTLTYNVPGDATTREFVLDPGADGDYTTPWDNELRYASDASKYSATDSKTYSVVAKWITPQASGGLFYLLNDPENPKNTPLRVQARIGDRFTTNAAFRNADDARSGPGVQGAEINIYISARNFSDD